MKLSPAEFEVLVELTHTPTGVATPECARLESLGLVFTGRSRFGGWARVTDAGRAVANRGASDGAVGGSSHSPTPHAGAVPLGTSRGTKLRSLRSSSTNETPSRPAAGRRRTTPEAGSFQPAQGTTSSRTAAKKRTPSPDAQPQAAVAAPSGRTRRPQRREAPEAAIAPAAGSKSKVKSDGSSDRSADTWGVATSRPGRSSIAVATALNGNGTRKELPSDFAPNAVRVTTARKHTYFPLNAYEKLHGTKERVSTRNKIFSSAAVGSPEADGDVLCDTLART